MYNIITTQQQYEFNSIATWKTSIHLTIFPSPIHWYNRLIATGIGLWQSPDWFGKNGKNICRTINQTKEHLTVAQTLQ
jgi:hypothetical protein